MSGEHPVRVGDQAPDFTLSGPDGAMVRLSDFRGRTVVLFFYPRDDTPVCTAEACAFRDQHAVFQEAGAAVIGVSADPPESHRRFAARLGLPYLLLSDVDGSVRARYGVPRTFGLLPGRTTYLIDAEGVVRHVFSSQFRASRHVAEALRVLGSLRGEGPG